MGARIEKKKYKHSREIGTPDTHSIMFLQLKQCVAMLIENVMDGGYGCQLEP